MNYSAENPSISLLLKHIDLIMDMMFQLPLQDLVSGLDVLQNAVHSVMKVIAERSHFHANIRYINEGLIIPAQLRQCLETQTLVETENASAVPQKATNSSTPQKNKSTVESTPKGSSKARKRAKFSNADLTGEGGTEENGSPLTKLRIVSVRSLAADGAGSSSSSPSSSNFASSLTTCSPTSGNTQRASVNAPDGKKAAVNPVKKLNPSIAKGKVKSGKSKFQTLKEFKCERCNEAFGTHISLRRHNLSHGDVTNYKCPTCGMMFLCASELQRHLPSHVASAESGSSASHKKVKSTKKERTRIFQCPTCPKAYPTIRNLNRHQHIKHNEKVAQASVKPLENSDAQVKKKERPDLGKSQKLHQKLAANKTRPSGSSCHCQHCGKKFKNQRARHYHEALAHRSLQLKTDAKPKPKSKSKRIPKARPGDGTSLPSCNVCGKQFYVTTSLNRHIAATHHYGSPSDKRTKAKTKGHVTSPLKTSSSNNQNASGRSKSTSSPSSFITVDSTSDSSCADDLAAPSSLVDETPVPTIVESSSDRKDEG